jgi:hypothetical protein
MNVGKNRAAYSKRNGESDESMECGFHGQFWVGGTTGA